MPQDLSYGNKAVGWNFNPSGNKDVKRLKMYAADFIDMCNNLHENTNNSEVKRMLSVAITECQTAQMWAVKAITWSDDNE